MTTVPQPGEDESAPPFSASELRRRFVALTDLLSALRRLLATSDTLQSERALLQTALSELAAHLGLGACSVFMRDGELLTCVAGTGFEEVLSQMLGNDSTVRQRPAPSAQFGLSEGIMGRALVTGELQSCTDTRNDPHFKAMDGSDAPAPIGSLISIPLREGGAVVGVLNVSHPQASFFDSWHQNALYLFAESLAQLLRNFRLARTIDHKVAAQTGALQQALAEAEKLRERFEQLAIVDELTGLHNRRHFFHEAPRIVAAAQRDGTPLSLVIADLDEFKRVNDTWGHTVGDQVLVRAAEVIEAELRGGDLLARLGGEEFGLLLTNTEPAGAMHLVERINCRLPTLPIHDPTAAWQLTASFGIAELTSDLNRLPVTDVLGLLYARADKAMYQCKTSGRARAEVYRPDMNLE